MRLFFYIKEIQVGLFNKNSKNGNFSTKNGPNGQNSQYFILIQYKYALRVSSWLGCAYSFNSRKYESIYWIKTLKIAIFQPIRLCLKSIQLIGMRFFFKFKEIWVDLLNKNSKNGHFSTKKWPLMAKNPNFSYWSKKIMP